MWKTMIVAATLACCVPLTSHAADTGAKRIHPDDPRIAPIIPWPHPPLPYEEMIRTEIKGKLTSRIEPIRDPVSKELCSLIVWEITAKGKTYRLDFSGSRDHLAQARKLEGRTVILTGMRTGNRVRVTSLKADDSDFVKKTVHVEMKGRFLFRADRADILLPDARLIVNGKTYVVNLGPNGPLWHAATAVDGHTAIVTGTLVGDRIDATSVKADKDFIHKTVNVEIKGQLYWNNFGMRCRVPEFQLTSGGKYFALDFANPELRKLAEKLSGEDVIVTGTLGEEDSEERHIRVASLKAAGGKYVKDTVAVTLRAKLHYVIKDAISGKVLFSCDKVPEPFCKCWALGYGVTINDKLYVLNLDGDKTLLSRAAMYEGCDIMVSGTLQGDEVAVLSLERSLRLLDIVPQTALQFAAE